MTGFGGARSRRRMRYGFARHGGSKGTPGRRPPGGAEADRATGRCARPRPARDRHGSARRARESPGAPAARGALVRPERARGARAMCHGRSRGGARGARPSVADARARRGSAHVRRPERPRQRTTRRAPSDPPAAPARPGDRSGRHARQAGPSRGPGHADGEGRARRVRDRAAPRPHHARPGGAYPRPGRSGAFGHSPAPRRGRARRAYVRTPRGTAHRGSRGTTAGAGGCRDAARFAAPDCGCVPAGRALGAA